MKERVESLNSELSISSETETVVKAVVRIEL